MSAQRAVSIGSRALQDSGPMCPNSTAQKELCFQAVGRIITEAMQVAPGKAGSMAAHVIFFKTQEPEADTIPQPLRRECIFKQLHKRCESCLDPGEELSPRPFNPARSCLLCKLKWDHKDWQCLNTLHEPGQSSTSQKLPANSTLRMGYRKVVVTGPGKHKGRYGFLATHCASGPRFAYCPTCFSGSRSVYGYHRGARARGAATYSHITSAAGRERTS